ncbi:hypothetical protein SAMN05660686_04964 [Thalassobaculum litoreum DSM 18839]|uniref:Uncharacterized protein n=2 Tax=Thalassobaculum TaxID=526215 RepID=A0A8G2F0C7_9PROT|nr:hypothetical protein SAMN05660686_04964 [Thalassobaculum litoreum DSM 18839]
MLAKATESDALTDKLSDNFEMGPAVNLKADDVVQIEAALRDLIWRVEYVRLLMQRSDAFSAADEIVTLLDTADARRILQLPDTPLSGDAKTVDEIVGRIE